MAVTIILLALLWTSRHTTAENSACERDSTIEEVVKQAEILFRGVNIPSKHKDRGVLFSLETIYKGAGLLADFSIHSGSPYNTTDRQVKVVVPSCLKSSYLNKGSGGSSLSSEGLIISVKVAGGPTYPPITALPHLRANAAPRVWTPEVEALIMRELGWGEWSEWDSCSVTCGGGWQQQKRPCKLHTCPGPSVRTRKCNSFHCKGAVSPLDQPLGPGAPLQGRATWTRVPERPKAWRLSANSYVWFPSAQLFQQSQPTQGFPKDFTLFISLRLRPESQGVGQGTLFSLRSRRQQDAYLSLELSAGGVRLVYAGPNISEVIHLTSALKDYRWHQIAISVHEDSTVKSYVDCKWLRVDVLGKDSLDTPKDADLIIGYLFSGDLEQLTVLPESGFAHMQCGETQTYTDEFTSAARYPT